MSHRPRRSTLIYLLLAWLSMLAIAGALLGTAEIRRLERQFHQASDALAAGVRNKLHTNEAVLSGLVAFLLAVDEDDLEATRRYAAAVAAAYPHIHMIEIARRMPAHEASGFVADLQRGDFTIEAVAAPGGGGPAGDVWPILFLYPTPADGGPINGPRPGSAVPLAATLARARGYPHAVASPVFELHEGGTGYVLLHNVERPAPARTADGPGFFGATMAAMLVIRSEALLPAAAGQAEAPIDVELRLLGGDGPDGTLHRHRTAQGTPVDRWLLPVFARTDLISTGGQRVSLAFEQQQRLTDVIRAETVATFILLSGAVFLTPWLMLRHYRALTRASIEHEHSAYLATHDVLTGLPNRYLLTDRFGHAMRNWQRNGTRFAVILIDLDHFKEINDRLGHEAGDQVLCAIAERMTGQLRSCDTVARYGGDEFLILLTNILDGGDAVQVGEKLLAAVSQPVAAPGGRLAVSCSIGIAVCPDHGTDLDTLRRHADMAMYAAKRSGRRAVVLSAAAVD